MSDLNSIGARLSEHVRGLGNPRADMMKSGDLSYQWTIKYLQLCQEAVQMCDGQPTLPRDVVEPVFFTTTLDFRDWYETWRFLHEDQINKQTVFNLSIVNIASAMILMSAPTASQSFDAIIELLRKREK